MTKSESLQTEWVPETKLEAKIIEAVQRRASRGTTMKSFNSIVLKFPKIDDGLRNCKAIFQEFGECKHPQILDRWYFSHELMVVYLVGFGR